MRAYETWMGKNDDYLAATVSWIRLLLQRTARTGEDARKQKTATKNLEQQRRTMLKLEKTDSPPALCILGDRLGLSTFEQFVLALCVAVELNTEVARLCAKAQGDMNKPFATFSLAFSLFSKPEWNVLLPHAPLRYWRLIELNQGRTQSLTSAALLIDERIVNYLKGINYIDERLSSYFKPLIHSESINIIKSKKHNFTHYDNPLPPSQQEQVEYITTNLSLEDAEPQYPIIELRGSDPGSKQAVTERSAASLGLMLYELDADSLPAQTLELETFSRLWQRECLIMPMPLALLIDMNSGNESEGKSVKRFLGQTSCAAFLTMEDGCSSCIPGRSLRRVISIDVKKPIPEEQQSLWISALNTLHSGDITEQALTGYVSLAQRLSEQFSFTHPQIKRLALTAARGLSCRETIKVDQLWINCRKDARLNMQELAQRIDTKAYWDQLVLPSLQKNLLQKISHQITCRHQVYQNWGFRKKMNRGLGISALFAGESGTGKTMAAEVIANTLNLDLYRIDLSAVVNKYIGETEKNLRKLFDTAEDSGAILFFDEADALFGKRTEVKDSHDRLSNITIDYLLQRIESYNGLAILATNLKSSLDKAFVRRLRFIVDFPFPEHEERKIIWQKVFPEEAPVTEDFDCECLAKLNLSGGNIHNVAVNAAFMAAQSEKNISMSLVLDAARAEFRKLDRPTKESLFEWNDELGAVG